MKLETRKTKKQKKLNNVRLQSIDAGRKSQLTFSSETSHERAKQEQLSAEVAGSC